MIILWNLNRRVFGFSLGHPDDPMSGIRVYADLDGSTLSSGVAGGMEVGDEAEAEVSAASLRE
jgi:hypothetical protein